MLEHNILSVQNSVEKYKYSSNCFIQWTQHMDIPAKHLPVHNTPSPCVKISDNHWPVI